MSKVIGDIVEHMQDAIQRLEVVGREPNGEVDGAIRNLSNLSKFLKQDHQGAAIYLKAARSGIKDTIQLLATAPDDREQTVARVMERLKDLSDFMLKAEADLPESSAGKGKTTKLKETERGHPASVQVPPSLRGEPADALDKPAREYSAEDQARINAGLAPFTPPKPTEQELKKQQAVAQNENAIRNERGGRIAASTAKIRGTLLDIKGLSKITADSINLELCKLEHQAFLGDGGPVGSGITEAQLNFHSRIKAMTAAARELKNEIHTYLVDEQQRLRSEADRYANEAGAGEELREAAVKSYAAYRDFTEANPYWLIDHAVGNVLSGLHTLAHAVGGK